MSLPVFLIESVGFPRNHHAILVETSHAGGGYIFQVTGNVQEGMRYEKKSADSTPETDPLFLGKKRLGWVAAGNMVVVGAICKSNPAPEKQFEGAKKITTYPVRRCQEWTTETIELLKSHGVLVGEGADDVSRES